MRRAIAAGIIACGFFLSAAYADEGVSFPSPQGYVNDYVGAVSGPARDKIDAIATEVKDKTGAEIALVVIPSTQPLPIELYCVQLFKKWGIGQKDKNNGVLLLIALHDKKLRIEVGYGLEGAIPDARAKNIIQEAIVPFFKEGNFNGGMVNGIAAIAQLIAGEYNVALESLKGTHTVSRRSRNASSLVFFIIVVLLVLFGRGGIFWLYLGAVYPQWRKQHRFWYTGSGTFWGSGGSSGGFGGFGGGFSGGGGASGGW